VNHTVLFAGLVGAIVWDLITWRYGLPTSSSHALIGGYAGRRWSRLGSMCSSLRAGSRPWLFIIVAPFLGWALGTLFVILLYWLFRRQTPATADRVFRREAAHFGRALQPGARHERRQKTMGIIAGVLFAVPAYRHLVADAAGNLMIPFWIVLMAHAAIALGTLSGGWRIVHTVGTKITKLQPMGGFAAETAGAVTLFTSSALGVRSLPPT